MSDDNFLDPNHALLVGMVLGALMKADLEVRPVLDEDGDYTDRIIVNRPISGNG